MLCCLWKVLETCFQNCEILSISTTILMTASTVSSEIPFYFSWRIIGHVHVHSTKIYF